MIPIMAEKTQIQKIMKRIFFESILRRYTINATIDSEKSVIYPNDRSILHNRDPTPSILAEIYVIPKKIAPIQKITISKE